MQLHFWWMLCHLKPYNWHFAEVPLLLFYFKFIDIIFYKIIKLFFRSVVSMTSHQSRTKHATYNYCIVSPALCWGGGLEWVGGMTGVGGTVNIEPECPEVVHFKCGPVGTWPGSCLLGVINPYVHGLFDGSSDTLVIPCPLWGSCPV